MQRAPADVVSEGRVLEAVLDRLPEHIAVLDERSTIVWVNRSWIEFGRRNGARVDDWIGLDYLAACRAGSQGDDDDVVAITEGICDVIAGRRAAVTAEYACHSPTVRRWFEIAVRRVGVERFVVVSHHDVTTRVLAERAAVELANTDPLTGLANRRSFDATLVTHAAHVQRPAVPMCVMVLDVDDFKSHNDQHGHETGDLVLIRAAASLREVFRRPTDVVARVGGDEFAVVAVDVDVDAARSLAEAVRRTFARSVAEELSIDVTLSVGVATGAVVGPRAGARLFRDADRSLMQAKRSGRDRVVSIEVGDSPEVRRPDDVAAEHALR